MLVVAVSNFVFRMMTWYISLYTVSADNLPGNLFNSTQREIGWWKSIVWTFSTCSKAQVSWLLPLLSQSSNLLYS